MPMPRLTTSFGRNCNAARRAMTLRWSSGIGGRAVSGARSSPAKNGLYGSAKVWWWYSGLSATTTQSTRIPGTTTWRLGRVSRSASRSTWAMTTPPLLRAAVAIARASSSNASRSIVRLPSGSAVVARMMPTSMPNAR